MTLRALKISSLRTKTLTDSICAVSTAPGRSAISIIRGSGAGSFKLLEDLFKSSSGKNPFELQPRIAHYGFISDGDDIVDDVIFIKFEDKASFTGEDSFEFHCHGNPLLIAKILELLYRTGLRPAQGGEFTRRAYLNGKLDIDAAQAIGEIIEARNAESLKAARRLRSGTFRSGMLALRSSLMNLLADLNAELDFIDEDISFATRDAKLQILRAVSSAVEKLRDESERFDSFKDGVNIAIVGRPNAGKSSLMNRLLGEERSIVSDIAGTTRDYIEGELTLAGFNVRLFDTAGLRDQSDDAIEKIGIERTRELMLRAHICLHLIDGSLPAAGETTPAIGTATQLLKVINKTDALHSSQTNSNDNILISVKTGQGIQELLTEMQNLISGRAPVSALPLNLWQRQLLESIEQNLATATLALETGELPEVISHTVGLAVEKIAQLTGEITGEDILGRIFSRFCIGK